MEVILQNRLTEIPKAHDLLDEVAVGRSMTAKATTDLHIALEGCLTNIVNHGYHRDQDGRIAVRFQPTSTELRIEIVDDARPFNPLLAPLVDVNQPLEYRPVGGLGIHMIRRLTDALHYEYRDRLYRLVLVKRIQDSLWQQPAR